MISRQRILCLRPQHLISTILMHLLQTKIKNVFFSGASNRTFQLFHIATVPTANEKCFSDRKERLARGHAGGQSDVENRQTR